MLFILLNDTKTQKTSILRWFKIHFSSLFVALNIVNDNDAGIKINFLFFRERELITGRNN